MALVWVYNRYIRIVNAHELSPRFIQLTYYHMRRIMKKHTLQGAQPRGSCTDNKHRVIRSDFRNPRCPKASGENIACKKSLFIANPVRNHIKTGIGIRHTHIFRLSTVYTAAKSPATLQITAIINISLTTKKAITTEGLNIDRNAITRPNSSHSRSNLLYHANHLMADGHTHDSTRNITMPDMKVRGANARKSNANNSIFRIEDCRFRLVSHRKTAG